VPPSRNLGHPVVIDGFKIKLDGFLDICEGVPHGFAFADATGQGSKLTACFVAQG
jgi:hypothetical protein